MVTKAQQHGYTVHAAGEERGDAARAGAETRRGESMSASPCVIAVVAAGSGAW